MHSFEELAKRFTARFNVPHFPGHPASLYEPGNYFLNIGGKRIRPVMCVMGNELFGDISEDAWQVAIAIELFHNFTLVHDDIMDAATLRRGMETVHTKYGNSVALLSGDVMMIKAYDYINKISLEHLRAVLDLFNKTSREVCEGQQLDMDFEQQAAVSFDEYLHMITLKTSVLLGASLKLGAIIGGAGEANCNHIYNFGLNLGLAFQIQDDYLDAFGDPAKFGKDVGGDIRQNKKTFLLLHALEVATTAQKVTINALIATNPTDKVAQMLDIFKECNVAAWANQLKEQYLAKAYTHLDEIAVTATRKKALTELAAFLIKREH
ncbi:polyprenyl synthetase family protein [Parasediminibacterium sp. JCM 36343]|uniref:polyprenyl synthetase family protein n=1 Tax=Parasediminibacterium sp. JCM 36343 TaxID=3374279 RepID=UPI00397A8416